MSLGTARPIRNERGFALFTVLIFAVVLGIAGTAFFAMSFYEARNAIYRENSSEAFYLADAAVERARGEFVDDGTWRTEEYGTALGNGTYDLVVRDTAVGAGANTVFIYSEGHVANADRAIEVIGDMKPGLPPLLAMRDIDVKGNFCLDGFAHANGEADWGPNDVHFQSGNCDGDGGFTEGFEIKPPRIYTERNKYPTATYYGVNLKTDGAMAWGEIFITPDSTVHADPGRLDSLTSVANFSFTASGTVFDLAFDNADIGHYFDTETGIFRKEPGTNYVVVNFTEFEGAPPYTANIEFHGLTNSIPCTIINTSFQGATDEQRLDWNHWEGGLVKLKTSATFEPENGIAIITHDMDNANAQTKYGTPDNPALIYVTRDFDEASGQMEINGACIVLRNFVSKGGPDITFYPELLDRFPDYLKDVQFGTTGVLQIFTWKEVAANP